MPPTSFDDDDDQATTSPPTQKSFYDARAAAAADEPDGDSLLQIEAAIDELSALMNLSAQNRPPNNFPISPISRRDPAYILSRPLQRKLLNLLKCRLVYSPEAKERLIKCIRSLAERTLTDLLLLHQNHAYLTKNLWMAVRNRGCQFLGPAMQEEVLRLILLALEDGSALSRKVLVLFVVQKLLPRYPRASKTSVGHVVQLLYRASCFKLQKREDDSSLMQLKEEFRNYEALRREHDAQIIQIAMDACIRISPESWSSLLYGDTEHRSQMQSIMDRLQMAQSQNFSGMLRELQNALQRSGDPYDIGRLLSDFDYIDKATKEDEPVDNRSNGQILTLLRRVQNLLVVYATVSPLFAMNKQNRQHHPLAQQNVDLAASSNSLTSLLINESPSRRFNPSSNLGRNWSSMSSILSSQPEIQNQRLYATDLHNSSQWIDEGRMNDNNCLSQSRISLPPTSLPPGPVIVNKPHIDANTAPSAFYTSPAPGLTPNAYMLKSFCNRVPPDDTNSPRQFSKDVMWREGPDSPLNRFTKLPPRSPTVRRCQDVAGQTGYRPSGLPPRRQWMSVNSVMHAAPVNDPAAEYNNGPCKPVDTSMKEEELVRLIRISKTIQNLEKQKHDLLERLGRGDVVSRNASSLTNLAGQVNMAESETNILQSPNEMVGFVSSNDTVVPFSQTPVHNKYGPICRSNKRLAQSLMAFPPLEEGDSHDDQIDDLLSEQTRRLLAFDDDEDHNDMLGADCFLSMKHATSMPAIQDDNLSEIMQIGPGEEGEENPFKWIDVLDETDEELKVAAKDKPRARSSIDLSIDQNDLKNFTFA